MLLQKLGSAGLSPEQDVCAEPLSKQPLRGWGQEEIPSCPPSLA